MANEQQYSLLALVHDRAASILKDATSISTPTPADSLLLKALRDPTTTTPDLDIAGLLARFQMLDLFRGAAATNSVAAVGDRLRELVNGFVDGKGFDAVRQTLQKLDQRGHAEVFRGHVLGVLTSQVGIGISFVTTLRNLADVPQLGERILGGWKDYFFGETGFVTVDGITIVAPGHDALSQVGQAPQLDVSKSLDSLKGLKGLLTERSAEQYVRDLIRITVEVAADTRYSNSSGNLRNRYAVMAVKVSEDLPVEAGQKSQDKAARWFKGVASLAESLVTSAVEEAVLGVSQFQTNPIIAATAATYAGTAARKATQHVFLSQVGV